MCIFKVPLCLNQTRMREVEPINTLFIYNEISVLYQKCYNQSMNKEFMSDVY